MKKILFAAIAFIGILAITGCSDEHNYDLNGNGTVVFQTSFSNDVKISARGALEDQLGESAILWISAANGDSKDGVVRKFNGLQNVPASGVQLLGGNYVAELWAGDSVSASYTDKYFKARAPFTVTSGTTPVELVGRIANVVTSVNYAESVAEVLTDCQMTVGHSRASLTFDDANGYKGYFMMPSTDKNLSWTLTGKRVTDGSTYTRSGVIENVKPTTEYVLNVKFNPDEEVLGGGWFDIVIDTTENPIEDEIVVKLGPSITGYDFDIKQAIFGSNGKIGRKSVFISASAHLTDVVIESSLLTPIISGPDVNLLGAHSDIVTMLDLGGINWLYTEISAEASNIKINFEESLLNNLDKGEYDIKFTATDANGKTNSRTLHISVSDAKIIAESLSSDSPTTWATSVTLTAEIVSAEAVNYGFEYRATGSNTWNKVYPSASRAVGDKYSVTITGLTPGTAYEYRAFCDEFTGEVLSFTTEGAQQVPNAGFESWQNSTPALLYASGSAMFWDSGNHGSATMSKNVTVPDTSVKHSGDFSACLHSQFVGIGAIGKFAAGNAFIGKYLETQGTDGVIGFGRPFTSRPKALRVWVKYVPGKVDYPSNAVVPALGEYDEGIVYFALLDGTVMNQEYPEFPVVVKTKTKEFFNKDRSDVVAYNEKIFTATEGDGMVEFVIPFEYKKEAKAKYLLMTFAASRGGDYFAGGNNSKMWIDDVELIYE